MFNKVYKNAETALKACKMFESVTIQCPLDNGTISQTLQTTTANKLANNHTNNSMIGQKSPPSPRSKIEDIQAKLQHSQNVDNETPLSLAAEVGNALLPDNNKLKHNLLDISL